MTLVVGYRCKTPAHEFILGVISRGVLPTTLNIDDFAKCFRKGKKQNNLYDQTEEENQKREKIKIISKIIWKSLLSFIIFPVSFELPFTSQSRGEKCDKNIMFLHLIYCCYILAGRCKMFLER